MKKILVVLLILSVAWGVFAQEGTWSLSAAAQVGTRIDFDPIPGKKVEDEAAVVDAIGFQNWQQPFGQVILTYGKGGLSTGLEFNTRNTETNAIATYTGETYKFEAKVDMANMVGLGSSANVQSNTWNEGNSPVFPIKRLWGQYNFLNGMVPVVVALNSYDNGDGDWTSDRRGVIKDPRSQFYTSHNLFDVENSFAAFDHPDLLMAKVKLDSLDFGVQVRNLFPWVGGAGGGRYASYGASGRVKVKDDGSMDKGGFKLLVDDVLKSSVLGLKFNMSPLEFAAQFKLERYGVYFGGRFFAGPVTAGLSFQGLLGKENAAGAETPLAMQFGGGIDYNAGQFGGGVNAYYKREEATNPTLKAASTDPEPVPIRGKYNSLIAVQPNFFFNAIPSHLGFRVDTAFYFTSDYFVASDATEKEVIWAVQPELYWNFKGTGASRRSAASYPWGGTGVIARYRMVSYDATGYEQLKKNGGANFLDLIFIWGL